MDISKENWDNALMADGFKEAVGTDLIDEEPQKTGEEAFVVTEENTGTVETLATSEAVIKKGKGAKSMSLFEWMEAAVFALIAISIVFAIGVRTVGVEGDSMNYTLLDGDKLLLSRWWYEPQHGDIVVVRRPDDEPLIKRVIACEGDHLDIDELTGMVILNGEELHESYLYCSTPREGFTGEVIVPEGYVFVMGDNRINSMDSRHPSIGFIAVEDIMGKALWRIAPMDVFGPIYDNE